MANTHTYKLKIGQTTLEGNVELSNAGVVSYTETSTAKMGDNIEGIVKNILEELSKAYADYNDFDEFCVEKIS